MVFHSFKKQNKKKRKRNKSILFNSHKKHWQKQQRKISPAKYLSSSNFNIMTTTSEISAFQLPKEGDKFQSKECIHNYVCDLIKFTCRNVCPTSENNKKRIRFACKHDGCLFSLLFVCSVKDGGDFVIRKYMDHSLDCPKLSPNMLIINKKSRYIYTKHRKEIEECKKTREKTEALQSVGLTVSPHTLNRIQRLKSSPSCHQDEGCSMLRNLFEFVTNDTHDEMNSCSGGVSIIEKDSEDRLVRAFLAPPACCTTAKNFLPQIVLDGTFSRGM